MNKEARPAQNWFGRSSGQSERLIALFLLALALFNPPLLAVFNLPSIVLGVPILYLYLFVAWAVVIVALALAMEGPPEASADERPRAAPAAGAQPRE